jgi:hypothetical protein
MAIVGVRTVIEGLVALHEAPPDALGLDRAVTFPCRSVTLGELAGELARVCAGRTLGAISWEPDAVIERIVSTWPALADGARAAALGVPEADTVERIIHDAVEASSLS